MAHLARVLYAVCVRCSMASVCRGTLFRAHKQHNEEFFIVLAWPINKCAANVFSVKKYDINIRQIEYNEHMRTHKKDTLKKAAKRNKKKLLLLFILMKMT